MSPRVWWARTKRAWQCRVGDHEWTTEVPVDAEGQRQGVLRQRCLHCGRVTDGLQQCAEPRYRLTQPGDRARLALHNPRLRRCSCRECEARRHDRVTRLRGVA